MVIFSSIFVSGRGKLVWPEVFDVTALVERRAVFSALFQDLEQLREKEQIGSLEKKGRDEAPVVPLIFLSYLKRYSDLKFLEPPMMQNQRIPEMILDSPLEMQDQKMMTLKLLSEENQKSPPSIRNLLPSKSRRGRPIKE